MENYQIAVIGAGPAGMMAAIRSSQLLSQKNGRNKRNVILIEKNDHLGRKLLLTGGGRCNITNRAPIKDMVEIFGKKGSFLKPALYNLDNNSLLDLFREKGLEFKFEEDGRVFPKDEKAISIIQVLESYLNENRVKLRLGSNLKKLKFTNGLFEIVLDNPYKKNEVIKSSKVILATGGVSYPSTGSTGTGIHIARDLGHEIRTLKPGLVPIKVKEKWIKGLSGLKLENIGLNLKTNSKKKIYTRGTVLFTHFGLSGPGILDLSHEITLIMDKISNKLEKMEPASDDSEKNNYHEPTVHLSLDLIPESSIDELNKELMYNFQKHGNRLIKTYLKLFLPNNMIDPFLKQLEIDPEKNLSRISKKERNSIVNHLKNLGVHITGTLPLEKGMITCGGISSKGIHSKTMESKLVPGMYFAGELIEFCGPTGGYNLQMAFSTGYTAGENAVNS
jgi:predicted flavoprotein YhiN